MPPPYYATEVLGNISQYQGPRAKRLKKEQSADRTLFQQRVIGNELTDLGITKILARSLKYCDPMIPQVLQQSC